MKQLNYKDLIIISIIIVFSAVPVVSDIVGQEQAATISISKNAIADCKLTKHSTEDYTISYDNIGENCQVCLTIPDEKEKKDKDGKTYIAPSEIKYKDKNGAMSTITKQQKNDKSEYCITTGYFKLDDDTVIVEKKQKAEYKLQLSEKDVYLTINSTVSTFVDYAFNYTIVEKAIIPSTYYILTEEDTKLRSFNLSYVIMFDRDISNDYTRFRIKSANGKYAYLKIYSCEYSNETHYYPTGGQVITNELLNSNTVKVTVNFNTQYYYNGTYRDIPLQPGMTLKCSDPLMEVQSARNFTGILYWGNDTATTSNYMGWNSNGFNYDYRNFTVAGGYGHYVSDYSRVSDIGVIATGRNSIGVYIVNTTTGNLINSTGLFEMNANHAREVAVMYWRNTTDALVITEQNSSMDLTIAIINITNSSYQIGMLKYPQPEEHDSFVWNPILRQHPTKDIVAMAWHLQNYSVQLNGTAYLYIMDKNGTIIFSNFTSKEVQPSGNKHPQVSVDWTADGNYLFFMVLDTYQPGNFTYFVYNFTSNKLSNQYFADANNLGEARGLTSCSLRGRNTSVFAIYRSYTGDSPTEAFVININGTVEPGYPDRDDNVAGNGNLENLPFACYQEPSSDGNLTMVWGDEGFDIKYTEYDPDTGGWGTTDLDNAKNSADITNRYFGTIDITPCPVGDCFMITALNKYDDSNGKQIYSGIFWNGTAIDISQVDIVEPNGPDGGHRWAFLFGPELIDINPNMTIPVFLKSISNSSINISTFYTNEREYNATIYIKWYVNGSNVFNDSAFTNITFINITFALQPTNFSKFSIVNASVYANDTSGKISDVQSAITNVSNSLPNPRNISILPVLATTDDTLDCNYTYFDYDSDAETSKNYSWFKDDVYQDIHTSTISSALTTAGEYWICSVTTYDGYNWTDYSNSSSKLIGLGSTTVVVTPGSGGGGATESQSKQSCNITLNPANLTFYKDDKVLRLILLNYENFSITPIFTIDKTNYDVRSVNEIFLGKSQNEVSVLRTAMNSTASQTLTISSSNCADIMVTINTNNNETRQVTLTSTIDKIFNGILKYALSESKIAYMLIPNYVLILISILVAGAIGYLIRMNANWPTRIVVVSIIILLLNVAFLLAFPVSEAVVEPVFLNNNTISTITNINHDLQSNLIYINEFPVSYYILSLVVFLLLIGIALIFYRGKK